MPQTGPKTATGKAAASRNAIRHGLLSEAPTVRDVEDPRDWQRHLDGITESFAPEGWHESFLANRIAALLWRLHRIQAVARLEPLSLSIDQGHQSDRGVEQIGGQRRQSIKGRLRSAIEDVIVVEGAQPRGF